jgi:hypothetical protein
VAGTVKEKEKAGCFGAVYVPRVGSAERYSFFYVYKLLTFIVLGYSFIGTTSSDKILSTRMEELKENSNFGNLDNLPFKAQFPPAKELIH